LLPHHTPLSVCLLFHDPPTTDISTLSLHDALPISTLLMSSSQSETSPIVQGLQKWADAVTEQTEGALTVELHASGSPWTIGEVRSEEHTSELQSRFDLVCRLLLEKKKQLTSALRCA